MTIFKNLNTPENNKANRTEYDKGAVFNQDIVEIICIVCYIPTRG